MIFWYADSKLHSMTNAEVETPCHIKEILKKHSTFSHQPYKSSFGTKYKNDIPHIKKESPSIKNATLFQVIPSYIEFTNCKIGIKCKV